MCASAKVNAPGHQEEYDRLMDRLQGTLGRLVEPPALSPYLPAMLRKTPSLSGFIEPCRPSRTTRPPSGPGWIHEIKHDGFRLTMSRERARVRCENGYDMADRFADHCVSCQSFQSAVVPDRRRSRDLTT
jgi:ATP-dependent DNA ligase